MAPFLRFLRKEFITPKEDRGQGIRYRKMTMRGFTTLKKSKFVINVDGSSMHGDLLGAAVLRKVQGEFQYSVFEFLMTAPLDPLHLSIEAEAHGLNLGTKLLAFVGNARTEIQTDCQAVFKKVKSNMNDDGDPLYPLISEIQDTLKRNRKVRLRLVKREGNRVADQLCWIARDETADSELNGMIRYEHEKDDRLDSKLEFDFKRLKMPRFSKYYYIGKAAEQPAVEA